MSQEAIQTTGSIVTAARRCLPLLCLLLATGCSSFRSDWHDAACFDCQTVGLEGRWEGTWCSHVNGHHGKLKAIITKQSENCYYAQFRATYAKVLPFGFDTPLSVTESDGIYHLEGQADLGWLAGGTFNCCGSANACELESGYCAPNDHGAFSLRRVCCE